MHILYNNFYKLNNFSFFISLIYVYMHVCICESLQVIVKGVKYLTLPNFLVPHNIIIGGIYL